MTLSGAFKRDCLFANDLTVDGLAERWMKTYREKQLKPHTVSTIKKMLPRVSAAIGHIKLANLRPGHIQGIL